MEDAEPLEVSLEPADEPPWRLDDPVEHGHGLLLFEAEECLARGDAEKAAVLASRAVKERPDSLTARALHERARRELLRGRRRERLEARVREAEGLLDAGDAAGAERIVTSALKFIPNHPLALALFGRLKDRRQQAVTAEAWAEQELERLTHAHARRALETAQAELAAGRERAALLAVRRGLRQAPDDPDLLAMLRDIEEVMERAKAGHHAVHAQVRAGLDLLAQGQIEESLKALRAVLRADADNVRAQVAVQQVRKAWLRRRAAAASAPPEPMMEPPPIPARRPAIAAPVAPPVSVRPPASTPVSAPAPVASEMSWADVGAVARGAAAPPARVSPPRAGSALPAKTPPPRAGARPAVAPSPRARGRVRPLGVILGCGAVLMGVLVVLWRGPRRSPAPVVAAAPAATARAAPPSLAAAPAETPAAAGPLAAVAPDLRRAIEAVLAAYSKALETADARLLAQARPDLGAEERARLLGPFTGALNAATDLRVLEVKTRGDLATVTLMRTDVIVGGPSGTHDPTEEQLHFWRRRGEWMLVR